MFAPGYSPRIDADLINQRGQLGIKRFGCNAKTDQRIERLGSRSGVYQRRQFRRGKTLQVGGHAIGLQLRDIAFRRLLQHAEPQQPFTICPQRPRPFSPKLFRRLIGCQRISFGDHAQRRDAGADGGN